MGSEEDSQQDSGEHSEEDLEEDSAGLRRGPRAGLRGGLRGGLQGGQSFSPAGNEATAEQSAWGHSHLIVGSCSGLSWFYWPNHHQDMFNLTSHSQMKLYSDDEGSKSLTKVTQFMLMWNITLFLKIKCCCWMCLTCWVLNVLFSVCLHGDRSLFQDGEFLFHFDQTVHFWKTLTLLLLPPSTQRSRASGLAWWDGSGTRPVGRWWDKSRVQLPGWSKCQYKAETWLLFLNFFFKSSMTDRGRA